MAGCISEESIFCGSIGLRYDGTFVCRVHVNFKQNFQVRVRYNPIFWQTVGHFLINLKLCIDISISLKTTRLIEKLMTKFQVNLTLSSLFANCNKPEKHQDDWKKEDYSSISPVLCKESDFSFNLRHIFLGKLHMYYVNCILFKFFLEYGYLNIYETCRWWSSWSSMHLTILLRESLTPTKIVHPDNETLNWQFHYFLQNAYFLLFREVILLIANHLGSLIL